MYQLTNIQKKTKLHTEYNEKLQFSNVFVANVTILFSSFCLEPRKVLPIFKTDEPVCPEGKLSCGNGECIEKELFCNGKPDCKDESDENACCKYNCIFVI